MAEKNKKNELKRIYFSVEYRYPKEMDDEKILDRFAEQILKDASDINSDSIQIMNGNDREVHCPKCGNPIVGITREIGSYKGFLHTNKKVRL